MSCSSLLDLRHSQHIHMVQSVEANHPRHFAKHRKIHGTRTRTRTRTPNRRGPVGYPYSIRLTCPHFCLTAAALSCAFGFSGPWPCRWVSPRSHTQRLPRTRSHQTTRRIQYPLYIHVCITRMFSVRAENEPKRRQHTNKMCGARRRIIIGSPTISPDVVSAGDRILLMTAPNLAIDKFIPNEKASSLPLNQSASSAELATVRDSPPRL
jgi:hypothetical protein